MALAICSSVRPIARRFSAKRLTDSAMPLALPLASPSFTAFAVDAVSEKGGLAHGRAFDGDPVSEKDGFAHGKASLAARRERARLLACRQGLSEAARLVIPRKTSAKPLISPAECLALLSRRPRPPGGFQAALERFL